METIDLYSGYEGVSEIVLTEESNLNEIILKVQLPDFYFMEVLSFIPLGRYNPDSVMYNYFRASGWNDDKWECKRLKEFYHQLMALDAIIIPSNYLDTYKVLKQICDSTLQHGNKLFIELE